MIKATSTQTTVPLSCYTEWIYIEVLFFLLCRTTTGGGGPSSCLEAQLSMCLHIQYFTLLQRWASLHYFKFKCDIIFLRVACLSQEICLKLLYNACCQHLVINQRHPFPCSTLKTMFKGLLLPFCYFKLNASTLAFGYLIGSGIFFF